MAVIVDECKHGLPQFVCRRCGGNDRRDPGIPAGLADEVNEDNDEPISVAEHKIFDTIVAAAEVNDPLEGVAEKTAAKHAPTVFPFEHMEAGKGGEGGVFRITNAEFIEAVIAELPKGASAAVCSKPGNPNLGGWVARRADSASWTVVAEHNNYVGCSSFYPAEDGSIKARKAQFAAFHFLMLDDLGTKVPLDRLGDFEFSWLIETSPGNYHGGIILDTPITDGAVAVRLLNAVIDAGLCDAGAAGPLSRWARLPVAINGKPKHADTAGVPFRCRLVQWRPDRRYSPQEIVDRLELELAPTGRPRKSAKPSAPFTTVPHRTGNDADDVLTPKAQENPVVTALKASGLYKTPLGSGKHDVTCPWVHEHTDELDTGAAYFEPDDLFPIGGFCCQHSHRDKYRIRALLDFLAVPVAEARHKPVIRVVAGDLHRVVDAAEKELANRGRHYQAGGLIVSVATDPASGDPSIVPTSAPALTRELSVAATWEKYDSRAGDWVRCDPPARHTGILFDAQHFRYLPPLVGVARQPYFRESDAELVRQAGYDKTAQRFGVFDSRHFVLPEPTVDAARAALALLEELLTEFHFVAAHDKAAALAAIFTAVLRPTLPHAPAFHVRAPVFGSGKTYLCELIGTFSGPGGNAKVSYPTTSEEATKVILSLLITSPACVEFDDMDTDWIPHGVIKRMLTAEAITDRILGVSKTATVSTRTLFLGSGNNVGPRTRSAAARTDGPSRPTLRNAGDDDLQRLPRRSGAPAQRRRRIGIPEPHQRIPAIIRPRATISDDALRPSARGTGPAPGLNDRQHSTHIGAATLLDAMREFPVEERGEINRSKLGWLLKKNADRIVGGFKFQQAEADGRTAWRVVPAISPPLPALPASAPPAEKTVASWSTRL